MARDGILKNVMTSMKKAARIGRRVGFAGAGMLAIMVATSGLSAQTVEDNSVPPVGLDIPASAGFQITALQRCQRVQDWVQKNVLSKDQIQIHPFGKTKPVATNSTPQGRALNRRVEIIIFRKVPVSGVGL